MQRAAAEAVEIRGGSLELEPRPALSLSLVLHELATKAVKYGALSAEEGRVRIEWRTSDEDGGKVHLVWHEFGGPWVSPPARHGFGTQLVERVFEYELGGRIHAGVPRGWPACRGVVPARLTWRAMIIDAPDGVPRVLVVEDEYLIALEIEDLLGDLGCGTIGPAPSASKALALIDRQPSDVALLDVNLGRERSTPIADLLMARRIPYALATGYDAAQLPEPSLRDAPRISKPVSLETLRRPLTERVGLRLARGRGI